MLQDIHMLCNTTMTQFIVSDKETVLMIVRKLLDKNYFNTVRKQLTENLY